MTSESDILIVGGGLNGPALALALAQAGLRVTIVDARPAPARALPDFDGRAYALALASVRVFQALGVWPALRGTAQPLNGIRTSQAQPGQPASPLFMGFDGAEIEEGVMGQMVEDRHLYAGLSAAMDATAGITRINGAAVVAQQTNAHGAKAHGAKAHGAKAHGASVTLDDGRVLGARLLVGCDGRDSAVAQRAGIRRWGWEYGQTALVCALQHEKPHDGIAHQVFLPGGPLAILPLPGNASSIVWSERADQAAIIAQLSDAEFLDVLRPRLGRFLGDVALVGARHAYPLRLTVAEDFVAPRLALVGDAAHGVHPIAGQGLNLGLRDVAALAEALVEAHRRGEDFAAPDVLERYQEWRRFDTVRMALGMDMVNRLFSNGNPVLGALRGLGLGAVNALPALRRHFIREAAGLNAAEPRLMQGAPL